MRRSKRSLEGEIWIDHTNSPGMPAIGPFGPRLTGTGKGEILEDKFWVCSHCSFRILINPARTRGREYCDKCDKYICDECKAVMHLTLTCRDMQRQLDTIQNDLDVHGSTTLILGRI